ncbi:UNVERIFIED_CONTAM: hypothetical protein FKN15_016009 [Acipenser sinensis]
MNYQWEGWGDWFPVAGLSALSSLTLVALFDSRAGEGVSVLLSPAGGSDTTMYFCIVREAPPPPDKGPAPCVCPPSSFTSGCRLGTVEVTGDVLVTED